MAATPLLTTKLYIPPPRPNLVPRPRLVQQLNLGLRLAHRLSLVSAPAGFGKTTLVMEWVYGSPREIAWVSLDEGDNDPVRFLDYVISALQQVDGTIGRTVQQALQSPQVPSLTGLVTLLINDVSAADTALTLVLDDYQLITAPSVHEIVGSMLEFQPPLMHLAISTRRDPPLHLPLLRARSQITEVRERDLRFTTEEASAFLHRTMGLRLSPEAVKSLEARTEGWITGLQLAALALQEQQDPLQAEGFVTGFEGDNRHILDYLVAEVLQRQPQAIRDFLSQTAILDRLTAPLCDALRFGDAETVSSSREHALRFGDAETVSSSREHALRFGDAETTTGREDSQAILDQLEAANLFLIPLDHRREWYRYHRLFAEVLRTMLGPEELEGLHQRAARWYEGQGLVNQALRHALALASESGNTEEAERLIRLVAEETLHAGGLSTVRGWLDALPDERVRASGELATYKAAVLVLGGEVALAEEYASAAERRLAATGAPPAERGKLLALRSFAAVMDRQDYEAAISLASGALQMLGGDEPRWRLIALWAMAESQERTRNISEAITTLREAGQTGRALGNQVFAVLVDATLAMALNNHGRRQEAVAVCEQAVARHTDGTGQPSPLAGILLSRLGMLYYEANQLQAARETLDKGLALSQKVAVASYLAHTLLAPILYAQGEVEAAFAALQEAYRQAGRESLTDANWLLAEEANLRLRQGDLAFARRWAEDAGLSPDDQPEYMRIQEQQAYARLLLAQARLSPARRYLAHLERFGRERGLVRVLITVHILQALVAERSGDQALACDRLSRAVEIASGGDYCRAFLDEDGQVMALLPEVRDTAPGFVDQLLDSAGVASPQRESAPPQPLVEPLSDREIEVLALIAAGLTNREIAQELVIAQGTVKRHINNIYGKLGVHSRTQAIARARELALL